MAYLLPELPVRRNTPVRGAIELIEFDTNRGMQKTQLSDDFMSRFRRLRYVQQGRKQIGQIEVECTESGDEPFDLIRLGIEQLHAIVHLLTQLAPIHIHEWIRSGNLSHNVVGDPGSLAKLGQVQLLDPAAFANVMNQVEGIAFSPLKRHVSLQAPTTFP